MLLQLCIEQSCLTDRLTACCVYKHWDNHDKIQWLESRSGLQASIHSSLYKKGWATLRLLSGQVNKIQIMWPFPGFKFITIVKLFFRKEKNDFCVREESLPYTETVFKSQDFLLANMQQINVHFCATQVHKPVILLDSELVSSVISKAYCFGDCIQITEITLVGRRGQ